MLGRSPATTEELAPGVEHPIELTAESLWTEVAGRLRGRSTTRRTGRGSARSTGAELTDDAFVLAVPNDFTREWIEGHFLELIRRGGPGRDRRTSARRARGSTVREPAGRRRAARRDAARSRAAAAGAERA